MTEYNELIYVDDLEADYVEDAVTSVYDEYYNDMKQEVEDELIEEGYEYEPASSFHPKFKHLRRPSPPSVALIHIGQFSRRLTRLGLGWP